jgi:hypothetical protein
LGCAACMCSAIVMMQLTLNILKKQTSTCMSSMWMMGTIHPWGHHRPHSPPPKRRRRTQRRLDGGANRSGT